MTVQSFTADTLHSGWGFGDSILSTFKRASARRDEWRRYRTVQAELLDYAPHQLAELGISEADIDLVADDASRR